MKILGLILLIIVAFMIWMAIGLEANSNPFCRHDWEEAAKKKDKHWTYIWYVCKKCKWTREACFTFNE